MKHQREFIKHHLLKYGFISRNYCLQNYVSRLGAWILILKKEGMPIEDGRYVKTEKGRDFIYNMCPPKSWEITTVDGKEIRRIPIY